MHRKKIKLLEEILGSYHKSRDEFLFFCPFCKHHKKKLSLNIGKNAWKCWVCDRNGKSIGQIVKKFGNNSQLSAWDQYSGYNFADLHEEEEQAPITLPPEFQPLVKNKDLQSYAAKKYLLSRGLDELDMLKWRIGYCASGFYRNRIIVPSFNIQGELNYFIARTYIDDWMTYKNPEVSKDIIFNELMIDFRKPVTLVEGVFDAINAENSIPLLGSTLKEDGVIFNKVVNSCQEIYLALDPDAEQKENKIANLLISYGIEVYKVPIEPYKDVGSMTGEEFEKRKEKSIVESKDYQLEEMILRL